MLIFQAADLAPIFPAARADLPGERSKNPLPDPAGRLLIYFFCDVFMLRFSGLAFSRVYIFQESPRRIQAGRFQSGRACRVVVYIQQTKLKAFQNIMNQKIFCSDLPGWPCRSSRMAVPIFPAADPAPIFPADLAPKNFLQGLDNGGLPRYNSDNQTGDYPERREKKTMSINVKWFKGCETMDELKAAYKTLAKRWHPDREGGDLKAMQEINVEFDELAKILPKVNAKGERYQPKDREAPEAFRAAVVAVQNVPGILVELCGEWLWITGNTKEHKEIFKAAGYRWSNNKAAWYWHAGEYRRSGKKKYTMDEIRQMHGSKSVKYDEQEQLPA